MNKTEILAMKCRTAAGHNIKCYSVLMELVDAGRPDIVDAILQMMRNDYGSITPEQIVSTYNACGGKEGFVARCNKMFNKKTLSKAKKDYDYEESLKRYNCGEQQYHPDGTKFENGKEINYD